MRLSKKPRKSAPRYGYDKIVWSPELKLRLAQAATLIKQTEARTYGVIVAESVNQVAAPLDRWIDDQLKDYTGVAPDRRTWARTHRDWRVVRQLLTESLEVLPHDRLTDEAIERFNQLTRGRKTRLRLLDTNIWGQKVTNGVLNIACFPAQMLWKLVDAGGLRRLKRCAVCLRWFFDASRNESAVRCSAACTRKWWNRARRRAANHKG